VSSRFAVCGTRSERSATASHPWRCRALASHAGALGGFELLAARRAQLPRASPDDSSMKENDHCEAETRFPRSGAREQPSKRRSVRAAGVLACAR